MRRKWVLVLVAVVVLLIVGLMLFPGPSKVTRENCAQVQKGMTIAEVESVFGGPPGDYRTQPTVGDWAILGDPHWRLVDGVPSWGVWYGDDCSIEVQLADGCVTNIVCFANERKSIEVSALVQWRLARWWGRLFKPNP
jgi:hypothetical protein